MTRLSSLLYSHLVNSLRCIAPYLIKMFKSNYFGGHYLVQRTYFTVTISYIIDRFPSSISTEF